ncbi:MAG: hypothetical protein HY680_05050 [Chloroflexi bacterium]|nr:hypothetical protein [Chloroflexota bacterium]
MLFIATHTHQPESCPVEHPLPVHQMAREDHAKECGVKVLGAYIASPQHILYFVLEAPDPGSVARYFRPLMKIGTAQITPVQTLQEATGISQ